MKPCQYSSQSFARSCEAADPADVAAPERAGSEVMVISSMVMAKSRRLNMIGAERLLRLGLVFATGLGKDSAMRATVVALLALAIIPACGPQTMRSAVGTLEVKAAVDSLWSAYAHASDRKDAGAFGALFTEDAVLVSAGVPTVHGRQAIQERLVSMYADLDPTGLRVEADETRVSGTIAVQSGTFEESF